MLPAKTFFKLVFSYGNEILQLTRPSQSWGEFFHPHLLRILLHSNVGLQLIFVFGNFRFQGSFLALLMVNIILIYILYNAYS